MDANIADELYPNKAKARYPTTVDWIGRDATGEDSLYVSNCFDFSNNNRKVLNPTILNAALTEQLRIDVRISSILIEGVTKNSTNSPKSREISSMNKCSLSATLVDKNKSDKFLAVVCGSISSNNVAFLHKSLAESA